MDASRNEEAVVAEMKVPVRVRYVECDPMNVAHHSVYPIWMEIARTDLLRRRGITYKDIEKSGVFIVVAKLAIRYRMPAFYDDDLIVQVRLLPTAGVKILHDYKIMRGENVIAEAETTLVCVNREGKIQGIPTGIQLG